MENTTMTNAMQLPRVRFACQQSANLALGSALGEMGQGTGVSGSVIGGGGAIGAGATTVVTDPKFYATTKPSTNDVAYSRSGRPPV